MRETTAELANREAAAAREGTDALIGFLRGRVVDLTDERDLAQRMLRVATVPARDRASRIAASRLLSLWAEIKAAPVRALECVTTWIDPEPRIRVIETRFMAAPFGSPEHDDYWSGSVQSEVRMLYRRRLRRRSIKKALGFKVRAPWERQ